MCEFGDFSTSKLFAYSQTLQTIPSEDFKILLKKKVFEKVSKLWSLKYSNFHGLTDWARSSLLDLHPNFQPNLFQKIFV